MRRTDLELLAIELDVLWADHGPHGRATRDGVLARGGSPLTIEEGPSFLVPPGTSFATDARLVHAGTPAADALRPLRPGNWEEDEWADLLAGALGPCSLALLDGRVVSICHTPRPLTALGAEAGVWTDPSFRGRGLAAATTASWAGLLAPTGRHLFYSTSASNRSSQRVAARLGLRPLGTLVSLLRT